MVNSVVFKSFDSKYQGLITQERSDKFALLGQLILNQREGVILSGCTGIGKTTFLNALKKSHSDIWTICLLQGNTALNFEQIQMQLISAIQEYSADTQSNDLQMLLEVCEQQQQQIVLAIDDAAYLSAGLINRLIEYALHNSVIRVIFALTKEQLYLKNLTDRAIDDCYFVEIPPLTSSQANDFIKNTLTLQNAEVTKKISRRLLAKFYRRTLGVPGKIIADLPLLLETTKLNFSKIIVLSSCCIVSTAVIYSLTSNNKQLPPPVRSISPPVVPQINPYISKTNPIATKTLVDFSKQAVVRKERSIVKASQVVPQLSDEEWVLQQDSKKYTLQLMALTKQKPLLNVVKKYQKLQSSLKVVQIKNRAQENYVLLYGSFANTGVANKEINKLPIEFRNAWPRRFDTLQKK